jgi:hypothetical protein
MTVSAIFQPIVAFIARDRRIDGQWLIEVMGGVCRWRSDALVAYEAYDLRGLGASGLHTFSHVCVAHFSTKERNKRDWEEERHESIKQLRPVLWATLIDGVASP